ncbi:MAG: hypothetical protein ACJ789_07140 [Thermomicrobiales bacterium]
MFRLPLEIEIFADARRQEVEWMFRQSQKHSPGPNDGGILGRARHLIGVALIVIGDHIAGDSSLVDRAQARDQTSPAISA